MPTRPRARALLACLACLVLLALPARAAGADAPQPARVLIVHSYDPGYIWTQQVNQGLSEALRGLEAELEHFYMDAKRRPDPERLRQSGLEALARIEATRPRLVIAVDDAAQEFLVAPHLKGRPAPQVIFCGINSAPTRYGYPASNVSGVRERWHFRDGFRLLKETVPQVKSAAFLADDSDTGRSVAEELRAELRAGPLAVRLTTVETVATYQQWQRRVQALCGGAGALAVGVYHSLTDEATGRVVPADQVAAWTAKACPKPSLGFYDATREHGQLCGVLESGQEQGWLAGTMAREVLTRGVSAGSLPIRVNRRGVLLLNLKTAQRLKVSVPYHLIESAGVLVR